jgi:hypothetical protein
MAGNIAAPMEVDMFTVNLQAGTNYEVAVAGAPSGSPKGYSLPDPVLIIIDPVAETTIFAQDNPDTGDLEPLGVIQVPVTGEYVLGVTDLTGGTGTYETLILNQQQNTFLNPTFVGEFIFDPESPTGQPQTTDSSGGPSIDTSSNPFLGGPGTTSPEPFGGTPNPLVGVVGFRPDTSIDFTF